MIGTVFVYNLFNERATLSLNGTLAKGPSGEDASRIEGLTKSYGTLVLLDQATAEVIQASALARRISTL